MISVRARSLVPLAPIVLVALALRPVADAPQFSPKEGTVVTRTFELKGTRELAKLTMRAGEKSQDIDGASMHIDMSWKYVTKDELEKCSKDSIQKLSRTYETLEKSRSETKKDQAGEDHKTDTSETCDLAGKTVLFAWDADKKEYTKKFDGEGDAELLENLELDMDYTALLPAADAEAGAKWEVDFADAKLALLRPGGDMPFHSGKEPLPVEKKMRSADWDAKKGKVSLELGKTTEEDGHKLATIKFHGDITSDADAERDGEDKGPAKLRVEDNEKFEGELVWDLSAGRASSIEWNSKGAMTLTVSIAAQSKDGEDLMVEQVFTFDTDYTYTGKFAAK